MAKITINGVTYTGDNVAIIGGSVFIDGKKQDTDAAKNAVEIRVVEGIINHLNTDLSVNCGDVNFDVTAGGSVNCDNVGGDVKAGGSVNCDNVGGTVNAGGSVNRG